MSAGNTGSGLRCSEIVEGALHLILSNRIRAVEDGRRAILRHFAPQDYEASMINRLEVIFEELVSNTVRHGFSANSGQSISVVALGRPGAIELILEDDGTPFDPLALAEPGRFTSIETAKIGGLGIPLVRKLSTAIRYERLAADPRRSSGGFAPCNRICVLIETAP